MKIPAMSKFDIYLNSCFCGAPWLIRGVKVIITCVSIFFKSFFNNYVLAEGGMVHAFVAPIFWIFDSILISIGPFLTVLVVFLSSFTVFIAYWIVLPYYMHSNKVLGYMIAFVGNWILLNFVFNYYMGFSTSPGHPPKTGLNLESTTMCKKCLTPKPPRTHHCSICDQCVLKMDHHCPWMNHCVGHWNHRYFYLFMVYTNLGCLFLLGIGYQAAYAAIFDNSTAYDFYYENVNDILVVVPMEKTSSVRNYIYLRSSQPLTVFPLSYYLETEQFRSKSLISVSFVLLIALIAVLSLSLWHAKLISGGETSVEFLKNKFEMAKMKKEGATFSNPFDFGWRTNWQIFLGLHDGRTFWRHILLPSTYRPLDNGVTWTKAEDIETVLSRKLDSHNLHSC